MPCSQLPWDGATFRRCRTDALPNWSPAFSTMGSGPDPVPRIVRHRTEHGVRIVSDNLDGGAESAPGNGGQGGTSRTIGDRCERPLQSIGDPVGDPRHH